MIPVLYESNEISFTSNGLGRLRDCISCIVTEERNGIYECDFEYPINGAHYDEITLGRIIAVTHDDTNDIQPFDIVSFEKNIEGTTTFHCTHISYRQSYLTVSGTNINSLSAAFSALSSAEPSNPFTYTTDKTSAGYVAAFDGIPRTVRSLLGGVEGSILDTFGGEYEWNKFNVILHAARGTLQDFSIRYGVNMTEYNDESGIEGTFSSCVPYWTDGTDTVKGNRVDSTYTTASGRNDCIPLDLSEKFEDKPTAAQLQTLALSIMQSEQTYLPTQTISVSFVRLQDSPEYVQFSNLLQCKLCDSVKVIFPDYNTSGNFKIVKVEWDALQERYNEMELGQLSISLADALGIGKSSESVVSQSFEPGSVLNTTYSVTLPCPGLVTAGTQTVYFTLILPKRLDNVSSFTVDALTGGIRGISGYVDGTSDSSNLMTGRTVTGTIMDSQTIRINITKSSALSNVSNNTPITVSLKSIKLTFS